MKIQRFYIYLTIFLMVVFVYGGYQLFNTKMTGKPKPSKQAITKTFRVSDVKLLGQVSTDILNTSPYYYSYEANENGKRIIIIVDQYFGHSGKNNPEVERSYIKLYPHISDYNQSVEKSDIISFHKVEVSDGKGSYEGLANKKIAHPDGSTSNLIFETSYVELGNPTRYCESN